MAQETANLHACNDCGNVYNVKIAPDSSCPVCGLRWNRQPIEVDQ